MNAKTTGRLDHLTFKGNLRQTRYGWLRLTPAYSVHLVQELLDTHKGEYERVLDPFCGTGTTALVCAERGISCDTTDINPFLLWLTRAKTGRYDEAALHSFQAAATVISGVIRTASSEQVWTPPLHQIEKWWDLETLMALGRAAFQMHELASEMTANALDLLKIAFCRTLIERANVSFGHQSMSFKKPQASGMFPLFDSPVERVVEMWEQSVALLLPAARTPILHPPTALYCDARNLRDVLESEVYDCVITSPPYPNRMSYIRELRPYMYWLGYLDNGRAAGELDWQTIGGTWGVATSNLSKWEPQENMPIPFEAFADICEQIARRSPLLSRYVYKYFHDMIPHCAGLFTVVTKGGAIHYVVGNSKFYDVLLPVEQIFAAMFEAAGFISVTVREVRKRTSKKELFEYVVSARKP